MTNISAKYIISLAAAALTATAAVASDNEKPYMSGALVPVSADADGKGVMITKTKENGQDVERLWFLHGTKNPDGSVTPTSFEQIKTTRDDKGVSVLNTSGTTDGYKFKDLTIQSYTLNGATLDLPAETATAMASAETVRTTEALTLTSRLALGLKSKIFDGPAVFCANDGTLYGGYKKDDVSMRLTKIGDDVHIASNKGGDGVYKINAIPATLPQPTRTGIDAMMTKFNTAKSCAPKP